MNSKLAIVLVALVGIGLYGLPSTMALFAGQHSFINIDPAGNQIACQKCHGDVQSELSGVVNTQTNTSPPHANMRCEFCHRLQVGRAAGDNAYALITYSDAKISNNASNGGKTEVSTATMIRWAVTNPADYEAQSYPANMKANDIWSGLTGTHDHSVALNPADNTSGTPVQICTYPECSTPLDSRLHFIGTTNYSSTSKAFSAVSVSPTFDISKDALGNTVYTYNATPGNVTLFSTGSTLCGGTLVNPNDPSKGFTNQTACPGAGGKIYPLVVGGTPLDNNTDTQMTGFLAGKVTWAPNGTSTWQSTGIFDGAGSRDSATGAKYHAASLIGCMDCHGGSSPVGHETARLSEDCELCHYASEPGIGNQFRGINAGGFGNGVTSGATDTGSLEVHKQMVLNKDSISYFGGRYTPASNGACIACHTHVAVNITWQKPTAYIFTASESTASGTSNVSWNTTNYATGGVINTTTTSGDASMQNS